jgi:hypothetical protein
VEDKEIIVWDSAGKEVWRYPLAEPTTAADALHPLSWFGQLRSNGGIDTLFINRPTRLVSGRLMCFSQDGRLRWDFNPGKAVSDGKLQYPQVYFVNSFRVIPDSKGVGTKIVVTSTHGWSYPDQVAMLDPNGKMIGEYWHAGHLTAMEMVPFGAGGASWIVFAGVDNGGHRATLVFLDPNNVRGFSAEDDDTYNLRGFPPAHEAAILWFERTCLNELSEEFNFATEVSLVPGGLQVVVAEVHNRAYVVYVLDKNLNVTYVELSSGFRSMHRELEQAGRLNHRLTDEEVAKLAKVHIVKH